MAYIAGPARLQVIGASTRTATTPTRRMKSWTPGSVASQRGSLGPVLDWGLFPLFRLRQQLKMSWPKFTEPNDFFNNMELSLHSHVFFKKNTCV